MDGLTIQDLDVLMEADDAWVGSSKASSMLGGLVFGALLSRGDEASTGTEFFKKMMDGEDEKEKSRNEIAITLKAKLLKLRDQLVVKEMTSDI